MRDVVCSVPHSGTRTLVQHLGIGSNSPRGRWLHFDYDDALLKKHKDLHLHIPMRDPRSVAASHARRGRKLAPLLRAYHSMLGHMDRPHTLHKVEDIPRLDGFSDWDRTVNGDVTVPEFTGAVMAEVVTPNLELFSRFYPGIAATISRP